MTIKRMSYIPGGTKKAFLTGLLVALAALSPFQGASADSMSLSDDRSLTLINLNSRERVEIEYCTDGAYVPRALTVIDRFLRDPVNGKIKPTDPKLLDLLFALHARVGAATPFTVICGYRSPGTNAALRARNPAVAGHSLHMEGKAVDIRLSGVPIRTLYEAALEMKAGGLGYYPRSGFIHVDVGPVRTW